MLGKKSAEILDKGGFEENKCKHYNELQWVFFLWEVVKFTW